MAVQQRRPAARPQRPEHARRVVKFHAPEIIFGCGSLAEAGHITARVGGRRPFVVTDPGLVEAGWADALRGFLGEVGLRAHVWTGLTPNPKDHEIEAGFTQYREVGGDVIVAIGGGSCIDAAKGIAILSGNGGDILDYGGVDHADQPMPPLVMIPSTSGTGADVSQFCIVTDSVRRRKVTIIGRALVPEVSVTDPRLLLTMPHELNASTGLDALTHAIEAYVSRAHNFLADHHALASVRLIAANLERTLHNPDDLDARVGMAKASLQAGLAFTNAILGATHAMSHQVGGLLDAPHGVCNAILLPHVIRFNSAASAGRFPALAAAVGLPVDGLSARDSALLLADWVRELADRLDVPRGLRELGVQNSDIDALAATTLDDACTTTNPRLVTLQDAEELFRAAL